MSAELIPSVIAGGATLTGGLLNSAASIWAAERQMDFQERMSGTAHQREVKDLIAAGLNPILSARHGGASSPPGARADVDIGADKAVTSALQAATLKSQIAAQTAQADQAHSAAELNRAQAASVTQTLPVNLGKIRADTEQAVASAGVSQATVNEIAQRINESVARIKLITQQADTESAKALKEKAFAVLWKGVRELLEKGDSNVRGTLKEGIFNRMKRNIIEYIQENAPGMIPYDPNSAKSLEERR